MEIVYHKPDRWTKQKVETYARRELAALDEGEPRRAEIKAAVKRHMDSPLAAARELAVSQYARLLKEDADRGAARAEYEYGLAHGQQIADELNENYDRSIRQRPLTRIPKRSTFVLTNSKGHPWARTGFAGTFSRLKNDAGFGDLHFHDLRGTAATRFYVAGLDKRVIAEILGWTDENVEKIIRRYVNRTAATRAVILQLNKATKQEPRL